MKKGVNSNSGIDFIKNFIILVLLIAILILSFLIFNKSNSTGMATYEDEQVDEVALDFPIDAWRTADWGECASQDATIAELTNFCIKKGYNGLYGVYTTGSGKFLDDSQTCYQEQKNPRYKWDGKYPMVKGTSTNSGLALTKIKCVKIIPADSSGSSGSSECPTCTVTQKDACQKLCGCSS